MMAPLPRISAHAPSGACRLRLHKVKVENRPRLLLTMARVMSPPTSANGWRNTRSTKSMALPAMHRRRVTLNAATICWRTASCH